MVTEAIQELEVDGLSSCPLPESARSHADCRAADTAECRPLGVLVIEDERLLLKAMEQGLRKRGFVVWAAPDGGEGVDLYRRFGSQIDVVLSDVQMPVLDGPKTLDALREINPSVRFCFMTGDTRSATLTNLLRRGAMRVFTKPFPSVAGVAEELWELATRPYDFPASPELGDDESAGPERTASAYRWKKRQRPVPCPRREPALKLALRGPVLVVQEERWRGSFPLTDKKRIGPGQMASALANPLGGCSGWFANKRFT